MEVKISMQLQDNHDECTSKADKEVESNKQVNS